MLTLRIDAHTEKTRLTQEKAEYLASINTVEDDEGWTYRPVTYAGSDTWYVQVWSHNGMEGHL